MAVLRGVKTQQIEAGSDEASQYEDLVTIHHNLHMEANNVFIKSSGGGTGTYRHVDGDVPASMNLNAAAAKTLKVSGEKLPEVFDIKILAKNVQSILNKDREKELLEEFAGQEWDVLCLNETW